MVILQKAAALCGLMQHLDVIRKDPKKLSKEHMKVVHMQTVKPAAHLSNLTDETMQ